VARNLLSSRVSLLAQYMCLSYALSVGSGAPNLIVTTWIGLPGSKAPFPGVGCCRKTASTKYNMTFPNSSLPETQLTNSFALPRTRPNVSNQCTSSKQLPASFAHTPQRESIKNAIWFPVIGSLTTQPHCILCLDRETSSDHGLRIQCGAPRVIHRTGIPILKLLLSLSKMVV
jgi:hypothetical protein